MLLGRVLGFLLTVLVAALAPLPAAAESRLPYDQPQVLPANPYRPDIMPMPGPDQYRERPAYQQRRDERRAEREARRERRLGQNDERGVPGNVQIMNSNPNSGQIAIDDSGHLTQQPGQPQQQQETTAMTPEMEETFARTQAEQARTLRQMQRSIDQLPERMRQNNIQTLDAR